MTLTKKITIAAFPILVSVAHLPAQVECDTFTMTAKIEGSALTFHLDTDLPEDTSVMVRVSKGYQHKGSDSNYILNYYSAKSKVSELKIPKTIELDNSQWSKDLDAKNVELSRLGPMPLGKAGDLEYIASFIRFYIN